MKDPTYLEDPAYYDYPGYLKRPAYLIPLLLGFLAVSVELVAGDRSSYTNGDVKSVAEMRSPAELRVVGRSPCAHSVGGGG